jgi:hypothetical protein
VKYIGNKTALIELLVHFCVDVNEHPDDLLSSPKLFVLYQQQLNKVRKLLPGIEEDLQFDYEQKINSLLQNVPRKKWMGIL